MYAACQATAQEIVKQYKIEAEKKGKGKQFVLPWTVET
jgi:hypothetical protein